MWSDLFMHVARGFHSWLKDYVQKYPVQGRGVDIYSDLCGEGGQGGERCQSEGRAHTFSSSLAFPDSTFLEIGKMSVSPASALHPS